MKYRDNQLQPWGDFRGLVDGKILAVGGLEGITEPHFAVDYEKEDKRYRIVFGYCAADLWVRYHKCLDEPYNPYEAMLEVVRENEGKFNVVEDVLNCCFHLTELKGGDTFDVEDGRVLFTIHAADLKYYPQEHRKFFQKEWTEERIRLCGGSTPENSVKMARVIGLTFAAD